MPRHFLIIPSEQELLEIGLGAHNAHHELPPPGMTLGVSHSPGWIDPIWISGDSVLPLYAAGALPEGHEDDWWWATVGDIVTDALVPDPDHLGRLLEKIASLADRTVSAALALPLLLKGTANSTMRWIRVTHQGILGAGVEDFQFKVDLGNPGDDPDISESDAGTLGASLVDLFSDAWTSPSAHWDSSVQFTQLGVTQIVQTTATTSTDDGNAEQSFPTVWTLFPTGVGAVQGGGLGPTLPFEVACAVTLQTDKSGPSGRGRLYLPPPHASAMTTGGIFSSAFVTSCLDLVQGYIDSINAAGPYQAIVVSPRRIVLNGITSVNCGQVPDAQRRRRRNQDEARVVRAITV